MLTKQDSDIFCGYFLNFLFHEHHSCLIGQYLLLPRLPPPRPEDTSDQLYRAVTKGREVWISPGCYEHDPWLHSQEIKGKQDQKNFQDVPFPALKLETIVTALNSNQQALCSSGFMFWYQIILELYPLIGWKGPGNILFCFFSCFENVFELQLLTRSLSESTQCAAEILHNQV